MKNLLQIFLAVMSLFTSLYADRIIPRPVQAVQQEGIFRLEPGTAITYTPAVENEAKHLLRLLQTATGYPFHMREQATPLPRKGITMEVDPSLQRLGREGYTLNVTPEAVILKAATPAGAFYGVQSLRQLLPYEIASPTRVEGVEWEIPCIQIQDKPRFDWRAFMLDEARHFKGMEVVKSLLDRMAELKMNVFHWHLTDDQGWRIEIKQYPRLTEVGSKRTDTQTGTWGSPTRSGEPHEGFYTQDEIREILAYAAERHITIVPEIGMPGHAVAAIASYPQLGTRKEPIEVMTVFGKAIDVYDPSDEFVYEFVSNVMDEVVALFPSPIIHIGGDEVRFDHWKASESVAELMKREDLSTMADVQIYFTNRIAEIVQSKGRNIMGWNEILGDDLHGFLKDGQTARNAKLDTDTVVHFWSGSPELAKRAIRKGHRIVNSWNVYTYLDYSYASIPLAKAYAFDPVLDGLTPEEQSSIIGSGCQMWGEWIPTVERMEHQIFPRLAAYAEVGWTWLDRKDFASFKKRLNDQLKRWELQGIAYARNQVNVLTRQDFFNVPTVDRWTAAQTPANWETRTFQTGNRIQDPGTYEVVFLYSSGVHALQIRNAELLRNGDVIDTDAHEAFSGNSLNGIVYSFELPEGTPAGTYTIRAEVKGSGGTDSNGEVKIRKAD